MTLKPAVYFPAGFIGIRIRSFDGITICETDVGMETVLPQEVMGRIITPEEAEAVGIDLWRVMDIGAGGDISLGEEMRDWRIFSRNNLSAMRDMGNGFIWVERERRALHINPRIRDALNRRVLAGEELRAFGEETAERNASGRNYEGQQPPDAIIPAKPLVPEISLQRQIQRPQTPEEASGIAVDMTECCIFRQTKRGQQRLTNFVPTPVRREYRLDATGGRTLWYQLRIDMYGQPPQLLYLEEKELENIPKAVQCLIDSATVADTKVAKLLENFVRERLGPLPPANDSLVLVSPGWQVINQNQGIYAFDNRTPVLPYNFETGRSLEAIPVSPETGWVWFKELLDVSEDVHITATGVLFSLMGLLFTIFERAEFPLQFALYLVGTTGSLKTSLARVLFLIFTSDETGRSHTFTDTPTAVEKYTGALRDEVGLVDDLELGDDSMEAARQRAIFNNLLRMIGDRKGKNRSNPALKDVKATVTHGLVAMTGEQTLGKQSNRLRMVEVEVTKGAIIGERLAEFQDHPERWKTICSAWIHFIEGNFSMICSEIRERSREYRREYQNRFNHARTIDQLIAFRITAELLRNFWMNWLHRPAEVDAVINAMIKAVEEVLTRAAEKDERTNPGMSFLLDVDALLGEKGLTIEDDQRAFEKNYDAAGYWNEAGDLLLIRDQAFKAVRTYEQSMGRYFPFDMQKILKSLDELGAVCSFANGRNRTFSVRKGGRNLIHIKGKIFRELVETNKEG